MSSEKMRYAFETWAEDSGQLMNFAKGNCGWYLSERTNSAWNAWQAATAATQRDAMAVAEAVREACYDACGYNCRSIRELDLAAIIEAVPATKPEPVNRQQDESGAWRNAIKLLVSEYWEIAYQEGKTGRNLADKANDVLSRLDAALAIAVRIDELERERDAARLGGWRTAREQAAKLCEGLHSNTGLIGYSLRRGALEEANEAIRAMRPPAEWQCAEVAPVCGAAPNVELN